MKIERHRNKVAVSPYGVSVILSDHPDSKSGRGCISMGVWRRDDGLWHIYKDGWLDFPPPAKRLKDVARPAIALARMGELTK